MQHEKNIENIIADLLDALGQDLTSDGLRDTPRRVAKWWREFLEYNPGTCDTSFEASRAGQLVVVKGMRVYSLCEHHLFPFWADVSIGVLTQDRTLGLSKFARVAHAAAHKLQIQERMTVEIAETIARLANTQDVIVSSTGVHLCMVMRGIKTHGEMTTVHGMGAFAQYGPARTEILGLMEK